MNIIRNPTDEQIADGLNFGSYLRVLYDKDNGDFIIWPGQQGLHVDAMNELNLNDDTADNLGIVRSIEDYAKLVSWRA